MTKIMANDPAQLGERQVLDAVRQRFPREYEICAQAVYIVNLETLLKERQDADGGTDA